jgi:hypothetical protein
MRGSFRGGRGRIFNDDTMIRDRGGYRGRRFNDDFEPREFGRGGHRGGRFNDENMRGNYRGGRRDEIFD